MNQTTLLDFIFKEGGKGKALRSANRKGVFLVTKDLHNPITIEFAEEGREYGAEELEVVKEWETSLDDSDRLAREVFKCLRVKPEFRAKEQPPTEQTVEEADVKPSISNEELINRCEEWIDKLCKSGGRDWCLTVPVNFNRDPDMLFTELIRRFKEQLKTKQ